MSRREIKILYVPNIDIFSNRLAYDPREDNDSDIIDSGWEGHYDDVFNNLDLLLKLLTDRQRDVIQLFIGGKSFREIAIILGLHHSTVIEHYDAAVYKIRCFFNC